jgi:single-strand DNA-binding protein
MAVASFSLATSTKAKDKEEVTMWHNCVAFGKLAEIVQQYVVKGSKLYCDGTIQYQQYEKDGEKRMATKIIVNDISMLSAANGNGNQSAQGGTQMAFGSGTSRAKAPSPEESLDDDIPF